MNNLSNLTQKLMDNGGTNNEKPNSVSKLYEEATDKSSSSSHSLEPSSSYEKYLDQDAIENSTETEKTAQRSNKQNESPSLSIDDSFDLDASISFKKPTSKVSTSTPKNLEINSNLHDLFIEQSLLDFGIGKVNSKSDGSEPRKEQKITLNIPRNSQILKYDLKSFRQNELKTNSNNLKLHKTNKHLLPEKSDFFNKTPSSTHQLDHTGKQKSLPKTQEKQTETNDDDIVILEVQKQRDFEDVPDDRLDVVKTPSKISISKPRHKIVGAEQRIARTESDKFLEPLLVSISKLQQEKNKNLSEYQELFATHSKAILQLEKALATKNSLQQKVKVLNNIQKEIEEGFGAIKSSNKLKDELDELKTSGRSICDSIEKLCADFKSLQIQGDTVTTKLSLVKTTQLQRKYQKKN